MAEVVDELNEAQQQAARSTAELAQYSVDEALSELQRAVLFVEEGAAPLQRLCVVRRLPALLAAHRGDVERLVLPRLLAAPSAEAEDVQDALADALLALLADAALPPSMVVASVLPAVADALRTRDEALMERWAGVAEAMAPRCDRGALLAALLEVAELKAALSEPVRCRRVACRLFGIIAAHADGDAIEARFLEHAMALCQDTEAEVRCAMAVELHNFCRSMRPFAVERHIVPELLDLMRDEEGTVRAASLDGYIKAAPFIAQPVRKEQLFPAVKRVLKKSTEGDSMEALARLFGPLVVVVWGDEESDEDIAQLLEFYRGLSERPEPQARQLCAFNLPAVALTVGPKRFGLFLHRVFVRLAEDECIEVRKTVAAGIHELASTLGAERSVKFIKDVFLKLMRDETRDVQFALAPHLSETVRALCTFAGDQVRVPGLSELITSIVVLCSVPSATWRQSKCMAEQVRLMSAFLPADPLNDNIVPVLLRMMHSGALPVQIAAADALLHIMRRLKHRVQREEVCSRMIVEFARSATFKERMLFLEFCTLLLKVFSRLFFKVTFFVIVLELAKDKVANVRLRLAELLPDLKRVILLPRDSGLLQRLMDVVSTLLSDSDGDVRAQAKQSQAAMSRFDVRMEGCVDERDPAEIVDQRLEQEEKLWGGADDRDARGGVGGAKAGNRDSRRFDLVGPRTGAVLKKTPAAGGGSAVGGASASSNSSSGAGAGGVAASAAAAQTASGAAGAGAQGGSSSGSGGASGLGGGSASAASSSLGAGSASAAASGRRSSSLGNGPPVRPLRSSLAQAQSNSSGAPAKLTTPPGGVLASRPGASAPAKPGASSRVPVGAGAASLVGPPSGGGGSSGGSSSSSTAPGPSAAANGAAARSTTRVTPQRVRR